MSTVEELIASNPFPGLRSFATSEADLFFGRRQQIEEVVARLHEVSFVAVTGSSGCGKSSLVLAGLLSELARRAEAGSGTKWCSAVLRPGNKPIARLAEQLSRLFGRDGSDESRAGALYGRLRLGGLGLVDAVSQARLDPQTRVLVVVDQFEEIFRFKRMTDPDEASAFVKLLLNAGRDPASPVSVVLTLRSDTLGYCADFRDLPETINRGQYLVPRLTREQRKETIVGPVELRTFKIAPRLVQRLLNDVSDDFDDLPVMQHVLSRTWSRWAQTCQGSRPIDLEDYDAVGTTRNALSKHAEEAFESLPGLEPVVEKVFRALTERIGEGTEIRRPLDFDRLCEVVGAGKDPVERVVERFRQPDTAFLMPPQAVPLTENPVIDISHESLIRQWQRLRAWVQAEAESRAMLLRLVEAARRFHARQGDRWRKQDLGKALEWQQATKPTPAWVALHVGSDGAAAWESAESFLAASAAGARRERWRGRLQVVGVLGLLLAILAAFVVVDMRKRAWSSELASKALLEIDQNPARSAYLGLAAMDHDPANAHALRQSLAMLEIAHAERILQHAQPVGDARYSRDGSRLVTTSGKTVTIFDSGTFDGQRTTRFAREANVMKAWLIAQNTILVTHTDDSRRNSEVQVQVVGDPALQRLPCEGGENWVTAVAVSDDERHVALGCAAGEVLVWDATDPAALRREDVWRDPLAQSITALAFSGDGAYLASGDISGVVNVWRLGHGEAWIRPGRSGAKAFPIKHGAAVRDIAFHPDNPSFLVTAGDDAQAVVWTLDLEHRRLEPETKDQPTRWPLKHNRPVTATRFIPRRDDTHPVVTVSEKTVRIWVDADAKQIRGHDDWVTDANASPDGERIVTASSDGTARLWSTRSGAPIAVLRGHRDAVNRAVFSPDGNQVVTASTDRTVRVWRFRAPRLLSYSDRWALSAAFEPDGTRVAVGEEGGGSVLELNDIAGSSVPIRHDLPVPPGAGQVSYMSWSRDRKFLVARGTTGDIFVASRPLLWDLETLQDITPAWLMKTRMAAFGPGTDELVAVAETGLVGIWDVKSLAEADPRPKLEFAGPPWIWMPAMSPDGKWIAALDGDKVALWRRDEPDEPPSHLTGHQGEIMALQFSRDSKRLLTASRDRTARIWSLDPPGPEKALRGGHTASLYSASFDPGGKLVVTAGADGTVRVWDAETANQLAVLRWHGEGVNEVQFGPDGKWIVSASDDGTVKLGQCHACNLTVEELRLRVPELAKLTEEETREIRRETQLAMPYFKRPAFLRRERRAEIKP